MKPSEVKELLIDNGAEYIRQHKDYKARLWRIPKPKKENIKERNVSFKTQSAPFDPDSR